MQFELRGSFEIRMKDEEVMQFKNMQFELRGSYAQDAVQFSIVELPKPSKVLRSK